MDAWLQITGALVIDFQTIKSIAIGVPFMRHRSAAYLPPSVNITITCPCNTVNVTFISRSFDFRIISESLNSQKSTRAVYKAYCNSLLTRPLFSGGYEFANICENFRIYSIQIFKNCKN